jgi:hypothetical protein
MSFKAASQGGLKLDTLRDPGAKATLPGTSSS